MGFKVHSIVGAVVVLLVVIAAGIGSVVTVGAQGGDGLSAEEETLLDRIEAANEFMNTLVSWAEVGTGTQSLDVTVSMAGVTQVQTSETVWERTSTNVRGDQEDRTDDVVQALLSASVTMEESGPQGDSSATYTVTAEARVVNDTLYVKAQLDDPAAFLPELSADWVVVTDEEAHPAYEDLQLGDLLERDEGDGLLDDMEWVRQATQSVTVEATTLEDGTEVDRIELVLGMEGVETQLYDEGEERDPFTDALIAQLDTSSGTNIVLYLDADGTVHRLESSMRMASTGIDAHTIDPENMPEGMLIDYTMVFTQIVDFSQFDETFEPVEAPALPES